MKHVCGLFLLFLSLPLWAQDLSNSARTAPQSYVEGQIAAAEVFQVTLPEISHYTEDGVRKFKITLESTLGEVERQWLLARLKELRRQNANIEFAVVGSDLTSVHYRDALKLVQEIKEERESLSVGNVNIKVPKEFNYQRQKMVITLVSAMIAGVNTTVGVLIGTDLPFTYVTLMASQASLMSGFWTGMSEHYSHWISRRGLLPAKNAATSNHMESFAKQWTAGTLYLYLMKQAAALTPIYSGVTNPLAILTDAAFIALQGLVSKFFYRQALNYHFDKTVAENPELKQRMQIWRMRTSLVISLVGGLTEQLANFHVPGATYALMGLTVGGVVLYKYVSSVRVKDLFTAILRGKHFFTAYQYAGTCRFLFL